METTTFPVTDFKVDGDGAGRFGGHVACFNNVDHGGDLIAPGATLASLPALIDKGFLAFSHDYHRLPIGMIAEAHEDGVGLWIAGPFHSTPAAQEARTVAAERLAAGKTMGLSIGYDPEEWTYRAVEGAKGPAGAEQVRVLTRIRILEGSLALLPMNERAGLSEVKGLAGIAEMAARLAAGKEGRELSAASRARVRAFLEAIAGLDGVRADLEEWLGATEPPPKPPKEPKAQPTAAARLRFDTDRLMARLRREGLCA